MSTKPRIISISLPPEMRKAIRQRAVSERRSISEVTREALRRYLETSLVPAASFQKGHPDEPGKRAGR